MPTPRGALRSYVPFVLMPSSALDAIDVAIRHQPEREREIETNRVVHATNERVASRHSAGKSTQAQRSSRMARNSPAVDERPVPSGAGLTSLVKSTRASPGSRHTRTC
jgi:hypothetical protein